MEKTEEPGDPKPATATTTRVRTSRWRTSCKMIAYVDLAILIIGLPMGIFCIVLKAYDEGGFPETVEFRNTKYDVKRTVISLMLISLICFFSLGILGVIKLFNATEIGRRPGEAVALARFWMYIDLVFIALGVIDLLFSTSVVTSAANLLLHTFLLFIVAMYFRELGTSTIIEIKTQANQIDPKLQLTGVVIETEAFTYKAGNSGNGK